MSRSLSIALLVALSVTRISADTNAEFQKFIKADTSESIRSTESLSSVPHFMKVVTSDFTVTQGGYSLSKSQALQGYRQQLAFLQSAKCYLVSLSAKTKESIGTATARIRTNCVLKPDRFGKSHKANNDVVEIATWIHSGATWKLKKLEVKFLNLWLDGKQMDAMAGARKLAAYGYTEHFKGEQRSR